MNVTWLGQPASHDPSLVGGKVAHLSRLADVQRVPPGFCVTTAALERAIDSRLRAEIAAAYRQLAERCGVAEPSVAVRSSAVDEDSSAASFAGQHETYLNIVGVDALIAAVARCWQSARSERALHYRTQQGLASERVRLAVLVQQLIAADVSAVVFSANPVTGERDEVMINASWGLGESIVSGLVTPDQFVVRKSDRAILGLYIAHKEQMTVLVAEGTREVAVPSALAHRPAITDEQVAELAQLAISLETTMGWPVDIECAYQDGQLYLLQCRPITTL